MADDHENWEARHKHTALFQNAVGVVQQGATASNTAGTILITLGISLPKMLEANPDQSYMIVFLSVIAWVVLLATISTGFARSAARIRREYVMEHNALFPGKMPYRLESYLLDFANRNPRLVGDKTKTR